MIEADVFQAERLGAAADEVDEVDREIARLEALLDGGEAPPAVLPFPRRSEPESRDEPEPGPAAPPSRPVPERSDEAARATPPKQVGKEPAPDEPASEDADERPAREGAVPTASANPEEQLRAEVDSRLQAEL